MDVTLIKGFCKLLQPAVGPLRLMHNAYLYFSSMLHILPSKVCIVRPVMHACEATCMGRNVTAAARAMRDDL